MKILVTGGAGLTGIHLATRLAKRGHDVNIFDVKEALQPEKVNYFKGLNIGVIPGDVRNTGMVFNAVKGVEQVYHLATAYRKMTASKEFYWEVDVRGTENLLNASLQEDVERFVHCSTTGVFGHVTNPPADENYPYGPYDVYQKAKCEGEKVVLKYFRERELRGVVVRPCGIYGPGDYRMLRLFKAIYRQKFVMVGKGEVHYHLIYVNDLVDAFELCGQNKAALGETYNIGGNEIPTLNELVEVIAETLEVPIPSRRIPFVWPVMLSSWICEKVYTAFGKEPPIFPRRVNWFIKNRSFDISKAKKELGFEPKIDLRTGIKATTEWYEKEELL